MENQNIDNTDNLEVQNSDNASELEELRAEIRGWNEKYIRICAEAENTRKRMQKSIDEAKSYAIFALVQALLPVYDNLNRALEHNEKDLDTNAKNILRGVEMTKIEFDNILKNFNIETISPKIGEKFDYDVHHAISEISSEEYEAGLILSTMQPGYKFKDRLLRPATVQVSKKL